MLFVSVCYRTECTTEEKQDNNAVPTVSSTDYDAI